jgi:hypothetical protein
MQWLPINHCDSHTHIHLPSIFKTHLSLTNFATLFFLVLRLARKGAIYAQIECKPNSLVHLYTTHAQASYQPITSLWDDDVRMRMNQFSWLHSLIAETSGNDGAAVLLNGDLNVDAAVHKEKSSPTKPSEDSSEEYEFMKAVLSGEGKKINGKVEYEDSWKIDLKDAVYESYGFHPVTFGDVKVDENGMVVPAETVLTDADEVMAVQSIDHVLWSPRQSNVNVEGVRVEKFLVADTHLDDNEDQEKGYTQVSGECSAIPVSYQSAHDYVH